MRSLVLILVLLISAATNAQQGTNPPEIWREGHVVINEDKDTLGFENRTKQERIRSENALRRLKNGGSIIIRLKTNDKSIEAYRKAGKEDIAKRMTDERSVMHSKIYNAFVSSFNFCPVYFIYAKDTRAVLDGKQGLFLNANMKYDSSIVLRDTFFVIADQGTAARYSAGVGQYGTVFKDKRFLGVKTTDYISDNASENSIVFLSKKLEQYYNPFPFCEGVYLENYNSSARALNGHLHKAYNRLVAVPEMREEQRKAKKAAKAKMKAL